MHISGYVNKIIAVVKTNPVSNKLLNEIHMIINLQVYFVASWF